LKTADNDMESAKNVARQIMSVHKGVRTVLAQESAVAGEFRVRSLKRLAGEERTTTKYRE